MYMENNTEKKPRKEEKIQKIKEREKERQLYYRKFLIAIIKWE